MDFPTYDRDHDFNLGSGSSPSASGDYSTGLGYGSSTSHSPSWDNPVNASALNQARQEATQLRAQLYWERRQQQEAEWQRQVAQARWMEAQRQAQEEQRQRERAEKRAAVREGREKRLGVLENQKQVGADQVQLLRVHVTSTFVQIGTLEAVEQQADAIANRAAQHVVDLFVSQDVLMPFAVSGIPASVPVAVVPQDLASVFSVVSRLTAGRFTTVRIPQFLGSPSDVIARMAGSMVATAVKNRVKGQARPILTTARDLSKLIQNYERLSSLFQDSAFQRVIDIFHSAAVNEQEKLLAAASSLAPEGPLEKAIQEFESSKREWTIALGSEFAAYLSGKLEEFKADPRVNGVPGRMKLLESVVADELAKGARSAQEGDFVGAAETIRSVNALIASLGDETTDTSVTGAVSDLAAVTVNDLANESVVTGSQLEIIATAIALGTAVISFGGLLTTATKGVNTAANELYQEGQAIQKALQGSRWVRRSADELNALSIAKGAEPSWKAGTRVFETIFKEPVRLYRVSINQKGLQRNWMMREDPRTMTKIQLADRFAIPEGPGAINN